MHIVALCHRKGWHSGRDGRWVKGQAAHNLGRRRRDMAGQRSHAYRGPGHESIGSDGYIYLIVAVTEPEAPFDTRRVPKHRWLWERKNGPVPKGHVLKSRDGNKTNTDPGNWVAIPRALLPRLSGGRWHRPFDSYEPELRPAILTIAQLDHAARTAGRK